MGYYFRFICTDPRGLSLEDLHAGIRSVNPAYEVEITPREPYQSMEGLLKIGDVALADIEVNRPGDGLFEEELGELNDFISDMTGNQKRRVRAALKAAKLIVAFQVLYQGREATEVFNDLDQVWNWLFANRTGVLQADDDGYYDSSGKLLSE